MSTDSATDLGVAELGAVALVGTARRPPPAGLTVAGRRVDGPPAVALLAAASLRGTAIRAGARAESTDATPEGHPPETLPAAPQAACRLLDVLLAGAAGGGLERRPLVDVWLRQGASAGYRLPYALLTRILIESGSLDDTAGLVAMLGERGRWLARQHPDWSAVLDDAGADDDGEAADVDVDTWPTADTATREAMLHRLRTLAPTAGRELVASTWSDDKAADRERNLRGLATNLGADDEPFLAAALADRSKKVRAAAVELLLDLPDSAWSQRLVGHLDGLARVEGRLRKKLIVELPDEVDELGDPPPGRSRRGHHLELLVGLAPLDRWTALTGWTPAELVARTDSDDVVRGWVRAASRRRDRAWAEALLPIMPMPTLVDALDADAEDLVARVVANAPAAIAMGIAVRFAGDDGWSDAMSRAVIARLRAEKHAGAIVRDQSVTVGARLDPSAVAELRRWHDGLGDDERYLAGGLRAIIQHVTTRVAITDAFAPGTQEEP